MASQVQQVFYIEDPIDKLCHNVIKKFSRDWCEIESEDANEDLNDIQPAYGMGNQDFDVRWCRDDVPIRRIRLPPSRVKENAS